MTNETGQIIEKQLSSLSPIIKIGQWGGFENGRIPLSALTPIQGSYLRADAATSMLQMQAAFHAEIGHNLSFNEGYRNYATQEYYWDQYQNHGGNVAARPGTSNHGWALAVDFNINDQVFNWLRSNADRFGWNWKTGQASGERWHWEYVLNGNNSNQPQPSQDNEMSYSLVKDAQSATIFVCSLVTGRRVGVGSTYHVSLLQRYKVNNAGDPMLVGELDIVAGYLQQIAPK